MATAEHTHSTATHNEHKTKLSPQITGVNDTQQQTSKNNNKNNNNQKQQTTNKQTQQQTSKNSNKNNNKQKQQTQQQTNKAGLFEHTCNRRTLTTIRNIMANRVVVRIASVQLSYLTSYTKIP